MPQLRPPNLAYLGCKETTLFDTILIANRGEIACRIAATAKHMGIRTVAVYSDADINSRHVQICDHAVNIGAPEPASSYLKADRIIAAAKQTGAQAIHPGYGFLSENADFAKACEDAGIAFIGPPASAISAMGSKSSAKKLMGSADVPLVPGYHGDNQEPEFLHQKAQEIGYPVLIKASAGGGGKGMRIVEQDADFLSALASCQREAASSFGNSQVLIERYLQKPRHVEIQVFADKQGNCVYLFERDCSVQRRYQKVIEEAPAPDMPAERRKAMGEAAVAAAKAVGYVGAGTVEFIMEPDGRFYFMEMNTRLQVEHPVTEAITGQDLVEWQIRVAAGQDLPMQQSELSITGHAMETRIYAENPDNDFLPSIGTLSVLKWPEHTEFKIGEVRVDGGVRMGDTITPFYDPMIAKLIVHGHDREHARQLMLQALAAVRTTGVHTNVDFLGRLMRNPAFAQADLDTGLIVKQHDNIFPAASKTGDKTMALVAAAILRNFGLNRPNSSHASSPWQQVDTWRVGGNFDTTLNILDQQELRVLKIQRQASNWTLTIDDAPAQEFYWQADSGHKVRIRLGDLEDKGEVYLSGLSIDVFTDGVRKHMQWQDPISLATGETEDNAGGLTAPMPGKILSIAVNIGDNVTKGTPLIIMEAMKMEHTIEAPHDGLVEEIYFAVGDQVTEGVNLIGLKQAEK